MKLLNVTLELKAIRTICSRSPRISGTMLASVDSSFFYYDATNEAFNRIQSLVRASGEIPTYEEICVDPVISENHRQILAKKKKKPAKDKSSVVRLSSKLDSYRKLRGLYFNAEYTLKQLKNDKIDPYKLLEKNTDNLSRIRTKLSSNELTHVGTGNNSSSLVKDYLDDKKPNLIPTGFEAFDNKNGGLPVGLTTIASTSGGGKSTLGNQLLINMSRLGYNCCIVPLEMTKSETMARILAERSGIDITKILRKKLTEREKKKIKRVYSKFVKELKKQGSRYSIFEPEEDMYIEEILTLLKPYGFDVIIIDYVNLLKGMDSEDEWRKLREASRFCKVYSKINNNRIILVAQLKDDGKIKYSGGITENSNNCWVWNYTDESRETGILSIRQLKARNQDPFPFELKGDFSTMRIRDVNARELEKMRSKEGDKKRQELDDFASDLTVDDEDIED